MSRYRTPEDDCERKAAREEMRVRLDDVCENKHGGNAQSVAANRRVSPTKVKSQQAILDTLRQCGPLTCKEIAAQRGVEMHTVSGRITELKELGLVRATDQVRDGGRVIELV